MREVKSEATNSLQVRIDAMTRGLSYEQAELWLEEHSDATAKELLAYLAGLADEAREKAIEVEMRSCKLDRMEASLVVDRYMSYRRLLENKHDA